MSDHYRRCVIGHSLVTTRRGLTQLTVWAPKPGAMVTAILADAEVVGIVFSLGMFMPVIPPARLVAGW